jgi:cell division septation protein DedD
MSVDRNVWIYGTGLLIVVGGCFAIGYTILPTKPAFGTKQATAITTPSVEVPPAPQPIEEPSVPKLVIEDITSEKAASAKSADEPVASDPDTTSTSPEELDITVDTTKKTDSPDSVTDPKPVDQPATSVTPDSDKGSKPIRAQKPSPTVTQPKTGAKPEVTPPPIDESVALFRVRINAIKPSRNDANSLVTELKDKGFSATILPLAGGFVVQTGAFKDRKSAEALQRSLTDNGYDTSITN